MNAEAWPLALLVNQERIFLGRQGTVREDGFSSPALNGDAALHELVHDGLQAGMIEALAQNVIKPNAKPAVDLLELRLRKTDHLAPDRQVLLITSLQLDQFGSGTGEQGRIEARSLGVALGADPFVDALHLP